MAEIPRPEYPRPSFVRPRWLCLNGTWEFAIDHGDSGRERGLHARPLAGRITVPFCPESTLSGVGITDFMAAVWYRRAVDVPAAWAGSRVLLRFQAVDHDATVYVDGVEVGRHRGGFTPFACDLGACAGKRIAIAVRARDDWRGDQARGKQSQAYANHGCHYTRTTGIWQTVWLEPVPMDARLERPRITPDVARSRFLLEQPIVGARPGSRVRATLVLKGERIGVVEEPVAWPCATLSLAIPPGRVRLWSVAEPALYDLAIELIARDGTVIDRAATYAGLRSLAIDGRAILLNGERVFQRLILDQGWWADGLMTAPTDDALIRDIELSQQAGFNGARLHQKIFEERFLWHADRRGYLCWGEFPDWGTGLRDVKDDHGQATGSYVAQWMEAIERDYAHPSIVGWCPLNEAAHILSDRITGLDDITRALFLATKQADRTRPVLDASGTSHRVPESDVYDSHDYEQDPAKFRALFAGLAEGKAYTNVPRQGGAWSVPYNGQPYFCSEFGGIWWNAAAKPGDAGWGYGANVTSVDEWHERFAGLCAALLDDAEQFGFCYTQLTDTFQEQNGIYDFARAPKFDLARVRAAVARQAAYERRGASAAGAEVAQRSVG